MNKADIFAKLDAIYDELDQTTASIVDKLTVLDMLKVRGHLDRWEALRSELFRNKVKAQRALVPKKELYKQQLRETLKGSGMTVLGRPAHFEERKAEAETANYALYLEVNELEEVIAELDSLLYHIQQKEKWLGQIRFELLEEEKRASFIGNKEYSSRD